MTEELTLARLCELAGINEDAELVALLLPRKPAEEMADLLAKLKDIWGIDKEHNLTSIKHGGEVYIATGVKRDC